MLSKQIIASLFWIITASSYAQNKSLEITYERNENNTVRFSYKKNSPGSTFIKLTFNKLTNSNTTEIRQTVKGYSGVLFTLRPTNKETAISFSYSFSSIGGNHKAKPLHDFKYILPFKKGKKIKIRDLSYLGKKFGNTEPKNWRSFQFLTKPNDTVYASRKGIVVKLKNSIVANSDLEYNYSSKSNYIIVEHEDGTLARYGVLKKNSFMIKLGSKVLPSTPMAICGSYDKPENSQLRFSVYYLDGDIENLKRKEKESLANQKHYYKYIDPVFYVNDGGESMNLTSGNEYVATCNNDIIVHEMTKREKKKRAKKN